MKKIVSQADKGKKDRRTKLLVSLILVGIMLLSTLGYAFTREDSNTSGSASKVKYNGFEFQKSGNAWVLQDSSFYFTFLYNPTETQEIKVDNLNTLEDYYNEPLYVYSEDYSAKSEVYRNLYPSANKIVLRMQDACIEDKSCEGDYPIKTCEDNFIIITESNSTSKIIQQDNCVFIEGKKENLTEVTDEFLFNLFGVRE